MKHWKIIVVIIWAAVSFYFFGKDINKHTSLQLPTVTPILLPTKLPEVTETPAPCQNCKVFDDMNAERVKAGLTPLLFNDRLANSAKTKACDIEKRGYWSHEDPDGQMPWHLFAENGYNISFAGENLARGLADEKITGEFMNSPTHKANVLNPEYKDVGVGKCGLYVVVHFGTSK